MYIVAYTVLSAILLSLTYVFVVIITRGLGTRPFTDEKQALEEFMQVAERWDYAFNVVRFSIIWVATRLSTLFTDILLFAGVSEETLRRADDTLCYWITRATWSLVGVH